MLSPLSGDPARHNRLHVLGFARSQALCPRESDNPFRRVDHAHSRLAPWQTQIFGVTIKCKSFQFFSICRFHYDSTSPVTPTCWMNAMRQWCSRKFRPAQPLRHLFLESHKVRTGARRSAVCIGIRLHLRFYLPRLSATAGKRLRSAARSGRGSIGRPPRDFNCRRRHVAHIA